MRALMCLLVLVCAMAVLFAAQSPKIECFSVSVDGVPTYHRFLDKPIENRPEVIRAAALRYGQEIELQGILSGDEKVRQHGRSIVLAVDAGSYTTGQLCACAPIGACGCIAGCGGPWCVGVKVKSIK